MPVTTQTNASHLILNFSGELNIYNATEIMDQIKPALQKALPIQVDLSEIDEIDAAGLQILMTLKLHAVSHGQEFQITVLSNAVIELLELSDMAGFFGAAVVLSDASA